MSREQRQENLFRWVAATVAAVTAFSAGVQVWSTMPPGSILAYALAGGAAFVTFAVVFIALVFFKTL